MMRVAIFLVLVAQCYASSENRIVNGTGATKGEIPYIVSLQIQGLHLCGGSILDDKHVLTAAHCVYELNHIPFLNIQYGVLNIQTETKNRIMISSYEYHPEYIHGGAYDNDIAILTLESSIVFSEDVKPIVLPLQDEENLPAGTPTTVSGWGIDKTGGHDMPHLQRVDLEMVSDDDCERIYSPKTRREIHICSRIPGGGKGECSADSGGPLYSKGKQVGVVSWSRKPCGRPDYPGVYARVAKYVDWIKERMNRE